MERLLILYCTNPTNEESPRFTMFYYLTAENLKLRKFLGRNIRLESRLKIGNLVWKIMS